MITAGIRELKERLSHYVRQAEAGQRIAVTAHGRVIAELVPPSSVSTSTSGRAEHYARLVASGVILRAAEPDRPLDTWPDIRAPRGTAAELIDSDRGPA